MRLKLPSTRVSSRDAMPTCQTRPTPDCESKKPSKKRLASLENSAFITSPSTTSKEQNMTTTQLTPAQHAILAHAVEHTSGKIDWFPDNIKGGARKKVRDGLFNRALITTDGTDWFVAAEGYDVLGMPRPGVNKTGIGQFEANLDQIIANAEGASAAASDNE